MLGLGNILTKGGALLGFPNKYSFNFDGSNDYLVTEKISLDFTNISISMWAKFDSFSSDDIFFAIADADSNDEELILYNQASNSNKFSAYFPQGSSENNSSYSIPTGEWVHLALTKSGTALKLYANGNEVKSVSYTNTNTYSRNIIIGARKTSSYVSHADALIDEVAVWNTALDATAIAKIASKPVDLTKYSASNLKLWLRAGDKVEPETSIARSDFYTDFDNTDDFVSVADNDDLSFGSGSADSPFSISAWINPVDATNFTIISKGVYNTDAEYIFWINGSDKLSLELYDESVSNTYELARYNTALTSYQGSWLHVCATYNGVGGTSANAGIKLYINGENVSTTLAGAGTYVAMENLAGEGRIGRYNTAYADGKISNLALHKTQLDAQTISQMAKSRYTPMRDNRFSVVDFDGSDDMITISDNSSLQLSVLTISAWIKPNGASEDGYIFSKFDDSTSGGYALNFQGSTDKIRLLSSGVTIGTSNAVFVDDNVWVHIAVTVDGSEIQIV